jgi:hypothetical protein
MHIVLLSRLLYSDWRTPELTELSKLNRFTVSNINEIKVLQVSMMRFRQITSF